MNEPDLSKPAFGPGAQTLEDLKPKEVPPADSQPEKEKVVEAAPKTEEPVGDPEPEEQKVPYSRFKKFHDLAIQAQKDADEWKAKAEATDRKPEKSEPVDEDVPGYWVELYGDSDASKKAWKIQHEANERVRQESVEAARRALQEEREAEAKRQEQSEKLIESNLEKLNAFVGRDLTEKEQLAVLNIVDDWTPKDGRGNYLGAPIPFEKAWELYELKNPRQKPNTESRDKVADLTASQSRGEPSSEEKNKSFNPLDWNAWKARLP